MALPYYPRYPRDFLDGTASMTFELKGAYSILLDVIYAQDGRCPDNDRYVSGLLGCSVRAWRVYKDQLVALGKIAIDDGVISNFRADKVLVKSRLYQEQQREKGLKPKKNRAVEKPRLSQSETEPDNKKEIDKSISKEKRGTRIDPDWQPSELDLQHAFKKGLSDDTTREQAERFRDYWISKSGAGGVKLDWAATWRTWVGNYCDRRPAQGRGQGPASNRQEPVSRADIAIRRIKEAQIMRDGWGT